MTIGINAAAAIKQPRTGVEEYTYQLIKHLTMLPEAKGHRFLLYVPSAVSAKKNFDFLLPDNFEIKVLCWPFSFLWTQIRLAWEMLVRPPETFFIPVHILPLIHPRNSIVAVHGLEYEYFPQYYSWWRRVYLHWSTKYALKCARKVIAISANTKNDLVKLYGGDEKKIKVVHHGIDRKRQATRDKRQVGKPYLLYLGRIEQKKNIQGILEAYKILKKEYKIPHQLILVGAPGYDYGNLKSKIGSSGFEIIETGYVAEDEKWHLFFNADIFLFPVFYEGFGLPVLEAQVVGTPVVTSFNSCLPEIAGTGALFVNPTNPAQIAEAVKQIIDDKILRDKLIKSGYENVKLFDWKKCAQETLKIIYESSAGA